MYQIKICIPIDKEIQTLVMGYYFTVFHLQVHNHRESGHIKNHTITEKTRPIEALSSKLQAKNRAPFCTVIVANMGKSTMFSAMEVFGYGIFFKLCFYLEMEVKCASISTKMKP